MDKFEAMAIFIEVVDKGSMSGAARKLNMPLPTLSRKLGELEADLGTKLLLRTTRRLELTDAGADYFQASKRIMEQVSEADRAAAGEYVKPKGELMIAGSLAFGRIHLLPVITAYLAQHPDVDVRLALSDSRHDVIAEHIDVAVRIGRLANNNLKATKIGDIRWVVVASPSFLDAYGTPATPDDLATRPCIGVDHNNLSTSWNFRFPGFSTTQGVAVRSRLAPSSAEAAVDAAIAGVGLTQVLHYQAAKAIAAGELRVVLADYEAEALPLSLVYAAQGMLPLKTRSFLDFAAPRLRQSIRFD
jgi:DNA-binding transcriptional LysR family regulator